MAGIGLVSAFHVCTTARKIEPNPALQACFFHAQAAGKGAAIVLPTQCPHVAFAGIYDISGKWLIWLAPRAGFRTSDHSINSRMLYR